MLRAQSYFEDLPEVSEDSNQILRNIFVGFGLCRNGIFFFIFMFNYEFYTSLFDLETRLMKWAQVQTTTRTTRCAVSMINKVVKEVYDVWGIAAFSMLPALASQSPTFPSCLNTDTRQ